MSNRNIGNHGFSTLIILLIIAVIILAGLLLYIVIKDIGHEKFYKPIEFWYVVAGFVASITLVIANLILVGITKDYANRTAEMAQATRKMAEFNQKTWEYDLRPLLLPQEQEVDDVHDTLSLKFANYGGLALFVNASIQEIEDHESWSNIVNMGKKCIKIENLTEKIARLIEKENTSDPCAEFYIIFNFQDKATNKYIQTIKYKCTKERWFFNFDEQCLPVLINKESEKIKG